MWSFYDDGDNNNNNSNNNNNPLNLITWHAAQKVLYQFIMNYNPCKDGLMSSIHKLI